MRQREATDEALQTEREDVEVSVMLIEKEQSHVQRHLESIGQYQVICAFLLRPTRSLNSTLGDG